MQFNYAWLINPYLVKNVVAPWLRPLYAPFDPEVYGSSCSLQLWTFRAFNAVCHWQCFMVHIKVRKLPPPETLFKNRLGWGGTTRRDQVRRSVRGVWSIKRPKSSRRWVCLAGIKLVLQYIFYKKALDEPWLQEQKNGKRWLGVFLMSRKKRWYM